MVGAVATGGAVVGGGGGTMVGAVATGGAVVGGGGGTTVGGVGGVVVMVRAAGVSLMAVAWELDMSPSPIARPPATRAAITAVRIPSHLVI